MLYSTETSRPRRRGDIRRVERLAGRAAEQALGAQAAPRACMRPQAGWRAPAIGVPLALEGRTLGLARIPVIRFAPLE